METRSLTQLQPLLRSVAKSSASTTLATRAATIAAPARFLTHHHQQHRQQSTTARTKRALRIAPHPSFLNSSQGTHVIYNPPASKPSVYHTPFKFLPRSDPRRRANLTQLLRTSSDLANSSSSSSPANDADLPPALPEPERKYNVTKEQVAEMRMLRARDPERWSVLKLAERYDCQPLFVMMCCRASAEHHDRERQRLEAVKARWGPMKTAAREERKKRKALLLKDAL
ncbi:mitochondrial ribosomal protein subunit L20-domain-containing protein [Annulohypoxylon truncatum]|uniref:mitochondrial ribosomal protein subunit L20-domain-containing protein n=1 Tax=Annulohypoxylon truncatum TaxID=327061 RepID=UPI002007ABD3|nr:mitochondrial ribosomal protein subunit L20-domain-containing protein [Annulohypoxylon truncatum]KAI1207191.1 mitochondrial ribosomal protein subunit L20-domain-containing protein [Annulohypoxylon truncatum]